MTLVDALSILYAASGVAGCGCYLPQILRLAHSAEARRSMALASWLGWLCLGVVALLYASVVARQGAMVLVCGLNTLCQAAVVALVVAQRRQDKRADTMEVSTLERTGEARSAQRRAIRLRTLVSVLRSSG